MNSVATIQNLKYTPHLEILGGKVLSGFLEVSGAKNSALVLLAASLLTQESLIIKNSPDLTDIQVMQKILKTLGVKIKKDDRQLEINPKDLHHAELPANLVNSLRASFFCIGPLLARLGKAKIPLPGGCNIGGRPVDEHIKGLKSLGADIEIREGVVTANVLTKDQKLHGANINLACPSVGATETIMMAASLALGTTIISNAAQEPEIEDLANMLNKMGARITGAGTTNIIIKGVKALRGASHVVIPDRIEAGTFLISAAITRSTLTIGPIIKDHLKEVISKLEECGCKFINEKENIRIIPGEIKGVDLITSPFPGFPTDLQAPFMALMATAKGHSKITENVYENRMQHVKEFQKMGAEIKLEKNTALIHGVKALKGAYLYGADLRASAAIVLASIASQERSIITGLHHLDRGYENLEKKLNNVGANITRKRNTVSLSLNKSDELGTPDKLESQQKAA